MKSALLLTLLSFTASAQIQSIATNSDGSTLWLESGFNLKSESEAVGRSFRIYRYQPDQPEILASDKDNRGFPTQPFVSADGQTTGWHTYIPCGGSCFLVIPRGGLQLTRNGKSFSFNGRNTLNLSRNGRWMYDAGLDTFLASSLTDLDTGASQPGKDIVPIHPRHAVSDAGTVVGVDPVSRGFPGPATTVKLWTPGSDPRTIYTGDKANSAGISADGRTVLIATAANQLIRLDTAAGNPQTVVAADQPVSFSMNADASRVAVLIGRQVTLLGSKTLYTSNETVTQIEMTDDGSLVFVLTASNRLVRVNVDTGDTQEIYPPMPGVVSQSNVGSVPGSALRFFTSDFNDKLTFSSSGFTFPVAKMTAGEFQVQIPWEFPTDESFRNFHISSPDSPLESRGPLFIEKGTHAAMLTLPFTSAILAAQQDFSGTVTQDTPAPAGSTIHMWLTGLGALDRPLKTGEPGPADPIAHPVSPLACYLMQDAAVGVKLPFIAYAPGLLGLYQVDATIPENWPAGKSALTCTTDNKLYGYAEIWTK